VRKRAVHLEVEQGGPHSGPLLWRAMESRILVVYSVGQNNTRRHRDHLTDAFGC
jgi:hypothetical protein